MKTDEFRRRWPSIATIPCVKDALAESDRLERALRELRREANRLLFGPSAAQALLRIQDMCDAALGYCGCPDCAAAQDAEDQEDAGA